MNMYKIFFGLFGRMINRGVFTATVLAALCMSQSGCLYIAVMDSLRSNAKNCCTVGDVRCSGRKMMLCTCEKKTSIGGSGPWPIEFCAKSRWSQWNVYNSRNECSRQLKKSQSSENKAQ